MTKRKNATLLLEGCKEGLTLGLFIALIQIVILSHPINNSNVFLFYLSIVIGGLGHLLTISTIFLRMVPYQAYLLVMVFATVLQYVVFGWLLWGKKSRKAALFYLSATVMAGVLPYVIMILFYGLS